MKVTVCQLHDARDQFADDWQQLIAHVQAQQSDLLVLPEMPFHEWLFAKRAFNNEAWQAALRAHDAAEIRLRELAPTVVCGSRPIDFGNERYNEAFIWDLERGTRGVHAKAYVPDEEGAWEASWYTRATPEFEPVAFAAPHASGEVSAGFLIGSELWAMEQARRYGAEGVQLLIAPRASSSSTADKWLAGGRAAAVIAGAYSLSSNRAGGVDQSGGGAWIIDPDGNVLVNTTHHQPFATAWLDLAVADNAKRTHPRSVFTSMPNQT